MIDIYVAGCCDETIQYVSSGFVVYEINNRIFSKFWTTDAKNKENINGLGELYALIGALRYCLKFKHKYVKIHYSYRSIGTLINKHKIKLGKATKVKSKLCELVEGCQNLKLFAVHIPTKKGVCSDLRYNTCKSKTMTVLKDKADSIEITSKYVLYTDGAYNKKTGFYGIGVVVYSREEDDIIDTIEWKDNKWNESGVNAGCYLAVTNAIEWCIVNRIYDSVTIVVTQTSAFSQATDYHRAKREVTKDFKSLIKKYENEVNFSFRHVYREHRNPYANKALELAENACGYIKYL